MQSFCLQKGNCHEKVAGTFFISFLFASVPECVADGSMPSQNFCLPPVCYHCISRTSNGELSCLLSGHALSPVLLTRNLLLNGTDFEKMLW
jgi:hypothetical protein